ncbi:hypothetical protein CORC01_00914 [Colletotrichum orchidophilum]|uniref:Uncharacterized protein n=1 Tax=Colletotrichum orchidophilum TaxID=1209926 RepID=A0A1G4BQI5_9PEZI|nr:uncharacterized protein CORC01_00914 [Colletotrichum orchidophilum]OHF03595.1 hypothetical protein CORC01_00914 [Colletotrichum orchidophilum]
MRSTYFFTLLAAIPAAMATSIEPRGPGTTAFIPSWEFEPLPGGKVHINGTVEEALAQLKQMNPNYEPPNPAPRTSTRSVFASLRRRQQTIITKDNVICNNSPPTNHFPVVAEGVKHLRSVKGQPQASGGPANCGRVSCSYGTAIWFCNDNTHAITLNSFKDIASMTAHISKFCAPNWTTPFSGQAFHPTANWNVVIHRSGC